MAVGAFLSAFAIEVFLIPSRLIDGGIVGIAMILGNIMGTEWIPAFLIVLNLPFVFFAYRAIGKVFVVHMIVALLMFVASLFIIHNWLPWNFHGQSLEVVVIGGAILGAGLGMVIRSGACLDGTEIMGIIVNKRFGFTVGETVLVCNVLIFSAAGLVAQDWHPAILSLILYMVAIRVMDTVIVGLDETKSILIISRKSREIAEAVMHELGLGLTVLYGRGGYSGDEREILYVIAERLQLSELKELVHREDPSAFMAIENLHEVNTGVDAFAKPTKSQLSKVMAAVFAKKDFEK